MTPRTTGCRWPAEWEPHAATWIAWPHNLRTWPGRFDTIPERFATIIRTLAAYEPVHVLAGGDDVLSQAEALVGHLPGVTLHDIPTNDAWVRDYGPTFLHGPGPGGMSLVDWEYNAWGGKYPPWERDNQVPSRIARHLALPRFEAGVVLEGGSIDGNGQGVVLTTESCLLDPHRNAGVRRAQMEAVLQDYLCAREIIWLPGGPLAGDDTDGHVDQLARFVGPQRVVVAVTHDPDDEDYLPLRANVTRLEERNRRHPGGAFEIIPLPLPAPIWIDDQRVPASYCNFYIANGCVLLPTFDDPADQAARDLLHALFPDRAVVPLAARDLIWGLGALHCMTQQQPSARHP